MVGGWRQSDRNKGIKNGKAYEKNGGNWEGEQRQDYRGTPGNSKFPLHRGIVISIQVFRMNYGPARLFPRVDIFGTGTPGVLPTSGVSLRR